MSDHRIEEFVVPDLGEGLEEVTLTCWHVRVGDDVALNQTLCSVETAKAEVEIPSPYAGRVMEICGAEGDVLPVGSLLVRIDCEPSAMNGQSPTRKPVLVGYGADDALDTSRRRPKAKPSVRKLAADLLVDLASVPAGDDGLVSRDAVLAAAGVGVERPGVPHDVIAVGGVRSRMAERMTLSRSKIPDAHASVQVDGAALLRLGDEVFTPFVLTLRLVVIALSHNKILNSIWVDGADGAQVHSHRAIHLGFAVATSRGLLVPVIDNAQSKTTRQLAECVARLVRDARAGTLKPAELTGSTFTVSNFGALGIDDGVPVINYPEAAILGMGSLKPRPAVVDDTVVVRPQMTLTCAFDHRIADGANAAQFLRELRGLIEAPETALLDL